MVVGAVRNLALEVLDGSYKRTTFERRAKEESGAVTAGLVESVLEGIVGYGFRRAERKKLDFRAVVEDIENWLLLLIERKTARRRKLIL